MLYLLDYNWIRVLDALFIAISDNKNNGKKL